MMDELHIRNLRGIRRLDATDLGRVNLVVGRNDVGKTTFLAATALPLDAVSWFFVAPLLSDPRPGKLDLDLHWLTLFPGADPTIPPEVSDEKQAGFRMELTKNGGRWTWPARFTPADGGEM